MFAYSKIGFFAVLQLLLESLSAFTYLMRLMRLGLECNVKLLVQNAINLWIAHHSEEMSFDVFCSS